MFERRTRQGLSKPEIMRWVKRDLAREVYHALSPTSRPSTRPDDQYEHAGFGGG
jgi:hypothetical protein